MKNIKIEICCGSADDAIEAYKSGIGRIELNSSLFLGGLTPTVGTLQTVKKHTDLEVMCMVRPREGGFCYTDVEFETMLEDARILIENGADGIVFGFLDQTGTIDIKRCKAMMDVIGDKQSVFHRAIDVVPDWKATLDSLIQLKVNRVLTSGQNPSVYFGIPTVAEMVKYANGAIEILPGGGITADNAVEVAKKTGCDQIHLTMHKICFDNSTNNQPDIYFGGMIFPPEDRFKMVDKDALSKFTQTMKTV